MHNGQLGRSPMHLLHRAVQCADDIFQRGAPKDVTPRQLAVLLAVAENEGANQTSLVEATSIDRSTVGDIVRRLVRRQLLQRRRSRQDTRAYAVKLTDEGKLVLRAVAPFGKGVDQRILEVLPADCRRQFVASLQVIVNKLHGSDQGPNQ
jgi:DNA-binding MarR family transcriptional regulator